jgi:hypothetical protein
VLIACCLSWTTLADSFDHGIWDGLLQRHVQPIRGGVAAQVDYAGMARERALLQGYLDALTAVAEADFQRWPCSG